MTGTRELFLLLLIIFCFFCTIPAFADPWSDNSVPGVTNNTTDGTPAGQEEITGAVPINEPLLVSSPTPVTAPAVIDSPGYYLLTNDLSNSTADVAIRITASDVVLEGNGHVLSGNGSGDSNGVLIGSSSAGTGNVTVRDLTVSGWGLGIYVDNQAGGEITDCTATKNVFGIYVNNSREVHMDGVNSSGNTPQFGGGGTGFTLYYSPSCVIANSTASENGYGSYLDVGGYGFLLDSSPGTAVINCTINGNANTAIEDDSAPSDLLLTGNKISENSGNGGIFLGTFHNSRTKNCVISGNDLSGNGAGIGLDQADNCVVSANTVTGSNSGIYLDTSRNATLTGNVMSGNQVNFQVTGTDEQYYQHDIGTSNTVNGRPIYYLYHRPGMVIDAASRAGTVYGIGSPGVIVKDLTFTSSSSGVFLYHSDDAMIRNVTSRGNQVGISVTSCKGVRVDGSIASGNLLTGIDVENSDDILLDAVTADSNINPEPGTGTGINVVSSSNVTVVNAKAGANKYAGIEISGGQQTRITRAVTSGNGIAGMMISGEGTEVTACRIGDNEEVGIGLIHAHGSRITDNWFSNTKNIGINDDVTGTTWNISKKAGTNIVNGPYLGGNYWANPEGTGWSQVTPDLGDGFCNAPFVIGADNTDYLPLHTYTKPTFYADFSVSPTSGTAPLTVKLAGKSTGKPSVVVYDFGDGTNATGADPGHTYRSPGVYTITLSIMKYNATTNSMMSSVATQVNAVSVTGVPFVPPVADFTVSRVNGTAPLTVTFKDRSTGSPIYPIYDFGDGTNATTKDPVHTYRFPGVYNVTLTVLKNDVTNGTMVSNTSSRKDLIRVG